MVLGSASLIQNKSWIESLMIGVGMAPRGAIGLIVASIGLTTGALDVTQFSIISTMAVLTSLIVPPILNALIDVWKNSEEKWLIMQPSQDEKHFE